MKPLYFVWCPACVEEHETTDVDFLDVQEDYQGRDIMTYRCPETGTVQNSLVTRGY